LSIVRTEVDRERLGKKDGEVGLEEVSRNDGVDPDNTGAGPPAYKFPLPLSGNLKYRSQLSDECAKFNLASFKNRNTSVRQPIHVSARYGRLNHKTVKAATLQSQSSHEWVDVTNFYVHLWGKLTFTRPVT
jgi:hypothetical protein